MWWERPKHVRLREASLSKTPRQMSATCPVPIWRHLTGGLTNSRDIVGTIYDILGTCSLWYTWSLGSPGKHWWSKHFNTTRCDDGVTAGTGPPQCVILCTCDDGVTAGTGPPQCVILCTCDDGVTAGTGPPQCVILCTCDDGVTAGTGPPQCIILLSLWWACLYHSS